MGKRSVEESLSEDVARVSMGQRLVEELQVSEPVLLGCEVAATTADGLCFLHAVLQQLDVESPDMVWRLVVVVLHAMVGSREP